MVTYPSTTSIDTEIQRVVSTEGDRMTFTKDLEDHWLVVNTNIIEGTDLPAWATEELYFPPFEWEPGDKTDLRTSMTQVHGWNLTCHLLASNTFQ